MNERQVECHRVLCTITDDVVVGVNFGRARQGPERDPGKVTQSIKRTEVREVSEGKSARIGAARNFESPKRGRRADLLTFPPLSSMT
jgi:hypothetical protein